MGNLATLLSDWFSADSSWIVFVLGCTAGWLLGLLWWWYYTGRATRWSDHVTRLETRLADTEATLLRREDDVSRLGAEMAVTARSAAEADDLRTARDDAVSRLRDLEIELAALPAAATSPARIDSTAADEAAATIARLQGQVSAARATAASVEREHAMCGTKRERMVAETREIRDRLASIESEHRTCADRNASLSAELAAVRLERDEENRLFVADVAAARAAPSDEQLTVIAALSEERDAARGELASRDEGLTDLRRELASLRAARDADAQRLRGEIEVARREPAEDQLAAVATLTGERDGLRDRLAMRDREIAQLREELSALRTQLADEARRLSDEISVARLAPSTEQITAIASLTGERDGVREQLADRDRDLATLRAQLATLREQREGDNRRFADELTAARIAPADDQVATIAALTSERDSVREQLTSRDRDLATLRAQLASLREQREDDGRRFADELSAARVAPADDQIAMIASLTGERDSVRERVASTERELARLRSELAGAVSAHAAVVAERDSLATDRDTVSTEREALKARLASAERAVAAAQETDGQLVALRRERDELRKQARRQLLDLQNEFEESTRQTAEDLVRLREQRKALQGQLRIAGTEVERLRGAAARADACEKETRRLNDRIAALEAQLRNPPKPKRPALDDLQRIYGVGPVLEQKLHAMGYLRFEDIARWSRADIERVATDLDSFPDRIERDAWVAQAQLLAEEMQREYDA